MDSGLIRLEEAFASIPFWTACRSLNSYSGSVSLLGPDGEASSLQMTNMTADRAPAMGFAGTLESIETPFSEDADHGSIGRDISVGASYRATRIVFPRTDNSLITPELGTETGSPFRPIRPSAENRAAR
ncbi:MAG: hypothetical protein JSV84_05900 [Gemmatimonadota bacterium]|nr:MAG: hypothetical protein JSV84_05900 [Gemmatimonadota bacterium]